MSYFREMTPALEEQFWQARLDALGRSDLTDRFGSSYKFPRSILNFERSLREDPKNEAKEDLLIQAYASLLQKEMLARVERWYNDYPNKVTNMTARSAVPPDMAAEYGRTSTELDMATVKERAKDFLARALDDNGIRFKNLRPTGGKGNEEMYDTMWE